jgi:hypothetical protein
VKKLLIAFTVIALCLIISACTSANGRIENVDITVGTSDRFSAVEIEEAINLVKEKFISDFRGCELLQLWYDEENSENAVESYMRTGRGRTNGISEENVIVLFSNFKAGSRADMTFNRNSIYEEWMWILIRDSENDSWRVDDWGY